MEPLTLWLNTQPAFSGDVSEIMFGATLIVVVLLLPRGIIPTGGEFITRFRTRGRPAVGPAAGAGPAATPATPPVSSGGAR
jgi:hypothetical protein